MSEFDQYCTFQVADLFFGLEVMKVQEVIRYQEMTRVPLAPRDVEGLINLRGQIVTAIDMRRRLGLPERAEGELPMNVVLTSEHGGASLLVDEIGDVLELKDDDFEPPPQTLDPAVQGLIRGVYKLEKRLLLVIDAGRAVELESKGQAA